MFYFILSDSVKTNRCNLDYDRGHELSSDINLIQTIFLIKMYLVSFQRK